ncbi:MAG: hypothetical protein WAL91_02925 [Propionicimonas sp.]
MPPRGKPPGRTRTALVALLVGFVGVPATASEVERALWSPVLEAAHAQTPVNRRQPRSVGVPAPSGADSWIAYTAVGKDGSTSLYVVTPDGSDLRQIPQSPPGSTFREWAPDGRRITFCAWPDSSAGAPDDQCREVPSVSPHLRTAPSLAYLDSRPKRSPDGRTLAFVRLHDAESPRAALITVDIISGLTSEVVGFEANVQLGIDWSPDGRLLAYTANPSGGPTRDLWVVGADGTHRRRLTRLADGATASSPTFSPDGTRIAVSVDSGGWAEIAVAELAGSVPEPVVGFRTLVPRDLDWSPTVVAR